MTRAVQKGFQVMSEGETLILSKISIKIRFDDKMAKKAVGGFLLATKSYKSENNATLLTPDKCNPGGKSAVHTKGLVVKKQ